MRMIEKEIAKLQDHVIICGFGRYGHEVAIHLARQKIPFVIIESNPAMIEEIQQSDAKYLYIEADASHDESLRSAGITRAKGLISAMSDDGDNMFTSLSARLLNPRLTIISRSSDPEAERKLKRAGADHVITPEQIGGFYMATLISKPDAVDFFTFITDDEESDIRIGEIKYEDIDEEYRNKSLRELDLRNKTGANVIGLKTANGRYVVNPPPDTYLRPGESFIYICDARHVHVIEEFFRQPGTVA